MIQQFDCWIQQDIWPVEIVFYSLLGPCVDLAFASIQGGPELTERSIQSIFQDFAGLCSSQPINIFTLLDRASISHYNNIQIIKFDWKLFIVMRHLLWTVIFVICPISRVSRHDDKLMANPKNDSR